MSSSLDHSELKKELQPLVQGIRNLAEASKEDLFVVLAILRELESLHRDIRTEMFEPNLPDTRHRLYLLIRHLEEIGGWPYIERMKLHKLCQALLVEAVQENKQEDNSSAEE